MKRHPAKVCGKLTPAHPTDHLAPPMPSEFELIRRYFNRPCAHTDLSVGDDAALVRPASGMQLAISTDMLIAGTHFFPDTDPCDLGWKALAVNLSDLAAMGAQARWAVLGLALPDVDEPWLSRFADGLFHCADQYGVDLVGGDTTAGPLNLCITAMGEAPAGSALLRGGERRLVPARLGEVLLDAEALLVERGEAELGRSDAVLTGPGEPLCRILVALRHAVAVEIHAREVVLRVRIAEVALAYPVEQRSEAGDGLDQRDAVRSQDSSCFAQRGQALSPLGQVVERGERHPAGEVPGDPEDDERVREAVFRHPQTVSSETAAARIISTPSARSCTSPEARSTAWIDCPAGSLT